MVIADLERTRPGACGEEAAEGRAGTLAEVFFATALATPEAPALEAGGRVRTYGELAAEASALAGRLGVLGVGRGDRVGVRVASGTAELYVAILGVLFSGAAYVPVDHDEPAERAEFVFEGAEVCAVVGDSLAVEVRRPPSSGAGPAGPGDECWVIFTSGSTGVPKGVAVTHRAAVAFVEAEAGLFDVAPDDRVLASLSVGFDASCEEMWLAWRNGACLVPCPRRVVQSGVDLGPWIAAHRISVLSSVPTLAAMVAEEDLAGVRLVILGGEALPAELGWRLAAGREVWNTYGPTEATVVSTAARVLPGRPVAIGRPLAGWEVAVVTPAGEPVPAGETGELVIAGVGLGRYLDKEIDAAAFAPLPALGQRRAYRSGDVVREGPDGLEFVGRRDDQVKINGRRLELAEVDACLAALPGVRAATAALRHSDGGNAVLVGYLVGDPDPNEARRELARRLPGGVVPFLVGLEALPMKSCGKVDRRALPWPAPALGSASVGSGGRKELSELEAWLAERFVVELGPHEIDAKSDFFALGGTSVAAAKLVSRLRERFPSAGVADVYRHRSLEDLAARLAELGGGRSSAAPPCPPRRRFGAAQLAGLGVLSALAAAQWLVGVFAYNQWEGNGIRIGWAGVVLAWVALSSAPARALLVAGARRLLLSDLRPGRFPRHGALALRLWFVERLADTLRLDLLAGTPWSARYARLLGAEVGEGARLGTLAPATGLLRVGAGATIEGDVDLRGWWVDGDELVVGAVRIGAGARLGTRCLLMPGAELGEGAEVEPGSVVTGSVPAGERWSGSPAQRVGLAGETWPAGPPSGDGKRRDRRALFGLGIGALSLLPLLAALPEAVVLAAGGRLTSPGAVLATSVVYAPVLALAYLLTYALLVVAAVRSVSWLIRPGLHSERAGVAFALWFSEAALGRARAVLFPLYSSVFTRTWLRLLGMHVGRRTEVSTVVGLNHTMRIGETSFVADDVVFDGARAMGGRIEVRSLEVGSRSFLGNGAILRPGTVLGDDSLVGVLSTPPEQSADGTSWLGLPAIELPRRADRPDPTRTSDPRRALVLARGAVEVVRILGPATVSLLLGVAIFDLLEGLSGRLGVAGMLVGAPLLLFLAGLVAVGVTVAAKWALIGRYRPGEHPLFSFYVWRDELVNSLQEQLAAAWLLGGALGTPIMPCYLRLLGARVGRQVWFETLAVTEFDLVEIGDGASINRGACIETHLFHDRLLRMGPATLGAGSTLGPNSCVLPDTVLGEGCSVGARSVVLRGERLPAHTAWQGAPVESC